MSIHMLLHTMKCNVKLLVSSNGVVQVTYTTATDSLSIVKTDLCNFFKSGFYPDDTHMTRRNAS
jgi:hypothetical protein